MYSESQKRAIMKWRETHADKYREYERKVKHNYYKNNKEMISIKKSKVYVFKKQAEIFRNILLTV